MATRGPTLCVTWEWNTSVCELIWNTKGYSSHFDVKNEFGIKNRRTDDRSGENTITGDYCLQTAPFSTSGQTELSSLTEKPLPPAGRSSQPWTLKVEENHKTIMWHLRTRRVHCEDGGWLNRLTKKKESVDNWCLLKGWSWIFQLTES